MIYFVYRFQVRVIAVGLRSESVSYHCLFCCQDQLHISKGVNWVLNTHYFFAYGTAYIMCPIPTGCQMPSHIAVISSAAEFNEGKIAKGWFTYQDSDMS